MVFFTAGRRSKLGIVIPVLHVQPQFTAAIYVIDQASSLS